MGFMNINARSEALEYLKTFQLEELRSVAKETGVSVHTLLSFRYGRHLDQRWSTIEAILSHKMDKCGGAREILF